MTKYYYNNKIDWTSTIINIIFAPFRFIIWLIKKILKYLKIVISDILTGVYKKLITIAVFVIVVIIVLYISNITHVQELKNLPLIAR